MSRAAKRSPGPIRRDLTVYSLTSRVWVPDRCCASSGHAPSLLPALAEAGEAHSLFGRPELGSGLVDALGLFARRHAVGDDAGARLRVHPAVLHDRGAQGDAGVHRTVGAEIADAAGIDAALVFLQLV